MISFVLLKYYFWKFSFISLSLILLYSKIGRYLYPFSSISLILSPSGISTSSDSTTFQLFSTNTPHFFIPNSIPISLLNICTMEINSFTSRSLCAKIFKSSINKMWFNFPLFFKVYPHSTFLNIPVPYKSQIAMVTNCLPLLISTFTRYSPHDVTFVFQFFINFLINCKIFSHTCTYLRLQ